MSWTFIAGFLQIVVIDLALSGDNAIVIGMAAASLPHQQRLKAIAFGGACAVVLRISLTAIVTTLIKIPLISALAGLVLFWVAWKLLKLNGSEDSRDQRKAKPANNFRQAILLILIADFTMSLDNILAIGGAAQGNYFLLIVGLLISMPLLMTTGGFISGLIDKFKWLPFIGAAVICFTGARMILEDDYFASKLGFSSTLTVLISIATGVIIPLFILFLNNRKTIASHSDE